MTWLLVITIIFALASLFLELSQTLATLKIIDKLKKTFKKEGIKNVEEEYTQEVGYK
jgi:hypothetical protein